MVRNHPRPSKSLQVNIFWSKHDRSGALEESCRARRTNQGIITGLPRGRSWLQRALALRYCAGSRESRRRSHGHGRDCAQILREMSRAHVPAIRAKLVSARGRRDTRGTTRAGLRQPLSSDSGLTPPRLLGPRRWRGCSAWEAAAVSGDAERRRSRGREKRSGRRDSDRSAGASADACPLSTPRAAPES